MAMLATISGGCLWYLRLPLLKQHRQITIITPASVRLISTINNTNKKELVVNTKWEKSVNPLYSDLVYSSEVDVALTAKRGKAWLEMKAAEEFRAKNDRKVREINAMSEPTPLALGYIYGGAMKVQREAPINQEILVEENTMLLEQPKNSIEKGGEVQEEILPYNIFTNIKPHQENTKHNDDTSTNQISGGRRRIRKTTTSVSDEQREKEEMIGVIDDPLRRQLSSQDHLYKHGKADSDVASSKVPCGGCGAYLHCIDEKIPGFLPSELFLNRSNNDLRSSLCQRCYIIEEYNVALKVNVSPEDYPAAIEHIKDKNALVLLVVDLLDFPGSVWPGILSLLGKNKKIIIVGNKLDLIVPDHRLYQKRITNIVREEFVKKCWQYDDRAFFPQIVGACCVSAVTGLNIEKLIEIIFDNWRTHNSFMPGDIYIVGCTNVGKSSLFNILLDSDLCKIKAVDMVQKAIISPVPGTTLNLLKFPVSRPEPHFMQHRRTRLNRADQEFFRAEYARLEFLKNNPKLKYALPSHYAVKHTLEHKRTQINSEYINTVETEKIQGVGLKSRFDPNANDFVQSKYCYDSPGTVSDDQIINLLTAEEISRTLANEPVFGRTFLFKLNQSILLGGVARLDYIEGPERHLIHPIMVTVFCSKQLPISIVNTVGVDKFLDSATGTKLVGVPSTLDRRSSMPPLLGQKVEIQGLPRLDHNICVGARDVVLSSAGWVMVSTKENATCTFIAYTAGGKGIATRTPFLPDSINQRGRRVPGTAKFRNNFYYNSNLLPKKM